MMKKYGLCLMVCLLLISFGDTGWARDKAVGSHGAATTSEVVPTAEPAIHWGPGFQRVIVPLTTRDSEDFSPRDIASAKTLSSAQMVNASTETRDPPALTELARALSTPDLIYEFVHDHIDYYPIWGSHKGAWGALMDRAGTAFDQAELMVKLVRLAGYQAHYVLGKIALDGEQAEGWFGTRDYCPVLRLLGQGRIDVTRKIATNPVSCSKLDGHADVKELWLDHIWVQVEMDGTSYVFDPSMKSLALPSGLDNLKEAIGYNREAYLAAATQEELDQDQDEEKAIVTPEVVQNLNLGSIRGQLNGYTEHFIQHLRTQAPAASLDEVIGGGTIIPLGSHLPLRQTTLPYQVDAPTIVMDEIPSGYRPTLRVQYQNIDHTFTSDELYGKRLSLVFKSVDPKGLDRTVLLLELYLEGEKIDGNGVQIATEIGGKAEISFSITHPAYGEGNNSLNESFKQSISGVIGGTYLIGNGWGPVQRA